MQALRDFPWGLVVKNPLQYRRYKRCGFDPWVGKIPWRRAWKPMDRGAWQATVLGVTKSRTCLKRLSLHPCISLKLNQTRLHDRSVNSCITHLYAISVDSSHSVQFSRSVVSDSLRPHESQHARPPCPSPTPGVHSDSRPSSQ